MSDEKRVTSFPTILIQQSAPDGTPTRGPVARCLDKLEVIAKATKAANEKDIGSAAQLSSMAMAKSTKESLSSELVDMLEMIEDLQQINKALAAREQALGSFVVAMEMELSKLPDATEAATARESQAKVELIEQMRDAVNDDSGIAAVMEANLDHYTRTRDWSSKMANVDNIAETIERLSSVTLTDYFTGETPQVDEEFEAALGANPSTVIDLVMSAFVVSRTQKQFAEHGKETDRFKRAKNRQRDKIEAEAKRVTDIKKRRKRDANGKKLYDPKYRNTTIGDQLNK